jgi:hypothetical protein
MKTRLILKHGQPDTKSLEKKYGDALLCVHFRYDEKLRQRLKTVELVVERTDWTPPPSAIYRGRPGAPAHRCLRHADAVPSESSGRKVES